MDKGNARHACRRYEQGLYRLMRTVCLTTVLSVFFMGCQKKNASEQSKQGVDEETHVFYGNSVKGHHEQDTITGNFTGLGIDTLYVVTEHIKIDPNREDGEYDNYDWKYYAKSNNHKLPSIELFVDDRYSSPRLVYEGDVDGDGKDEWGYLPVVENSQWSTYRIYNYDNKTRKWRYLYKDKTDADPMLLFTGEFFRGSEREVVEKGPKSGYIKINYATDGVNQELRDTIVRATYTPITEANL